MGAVVVGGTVFVVEAVVVCIDTVGVALFVVNIVVGTCGAVEGVVIGWFAVGAVLMATVVCLHETAFGVLDLDWY